MTKVRKNIYIDDKVYQLSNVVAGFKGLNSVSALIEYLLVQEINTSGELTINDLLREK